MSSGQTVVDVPFLTTVWKGHQCSQCEGLSLRQKVLGLTLQGGAAETPVYIHVFACKGTVYSEPTECQSKGCGLQF